VSSITLEEAQANLSRLLDQLRPGEEITITEHGRPLAQVKKAAPNSWPSKAGSYKKAEFWMAADFDAPLEDFKDYIECRR
jgi:prevent-host-death family protein